MPRGMYPRDKVFGQRLTNQIAQYRKTFPESIRISCVERYQSGEAILNIATDIGCCTGSIRRWLRDANSPADGRRGISFNIESLSELQKAYIAGLFDGEGSVVIVSPKTNGKRPWLQISITNTDKSIIDYLLTSLGGHISRTHKPKPKQKECWAWRATSKQAIYILKCLLPYLWIKRHKAEGAINYIW